MIRNVGRFAAMKITHLDLFHVAPRWQFLKISTDEGICGWGEPILEGHARAVEAAVRELEPVLIGQDPRRIEALWQLMYRGAFYRGGPVQMSAVSGVEQALWDIKGKYYHMPVYEMLGGKCRNSVRMYGHLKPAGQPGDFPVEAMLEIARQRVREGFTVVKYSVIPPVLPIDHPSAVDRMAERFSAVRETVGRDVDIAVDFHGRVSPAMAKQFCKALEPFHPFFVEEPCLPENPEAMIDIARSTVIPIAAGERLYTRWGFRILIESRAVSVFQPDVCHTGGILETKKIAAMAEMNYASIAPHNPLGPISLAACLQVDACCPNVLVQEHPGMPDHLDLGVGLLKNPFVVRNGEIAIPDGDGLGIEVDEEAVRQHRYDGKWQTPTITLPDGSMADW